MDRLKNLYRAPASTATGAAVGALFAANAATTPQVGESWVDTTVFVLNILGALISVVVGALKGAR